MDRGGSFNVVWARAIHHLHWKKVSLFWIELKKCYVDFGLTAVREIGVVGLVSTPLSVVVVVSLRSVRVS